MDHRPRRASRQDTRGITPATPLDGHHSGQTEAGDASCPDFLAVGPFPTIHNAAEHPPLGLVREQ